MDTYNVIASWAGWPVVVALLLVASGYGYWALNNRIEGLKDNNDFLKTKLDEAKNSSPDVLLERLASRHEILCEELGRLNADEQANQQRIFELESERGKIAMELGSVVSQLFKAVDSLNGYGCVFCYSNNRYQMQIPIELVGKEFVFDMNTICYACGRRNTQITTVSGDS